MDITSHPRYKSVIHSFSKDICELTRKVVLEELRATIHASPYARLQRPVRKPLKRLAAPQKRLHFKPKLLAT